ncbi:LOW QUALITY PROTEIN: uncharacterized protein M6D78_011891 [Vipera latastei]
MGIQTRDELFGQSLRLACCRLLQPRDLSRLSSWALPDGQMFAGFCTPEVPASGWATGPFQPAPPPPPLPAWPEKVKRPMNAFMVWSCEQRWRIEQEQPRLHNSEISKRLGTAWQCLDAAQSGPSLKAKRLWVCHMLGYPDYKYWPRRRSRAGQEPGGLSPASLPGPSTSLRWMSTCAGSPDKLHGTASQPGLAPAGGGGGYVMGDTAAPCSSLVYSTPSPPAFATMPRKLDTGLQHSLGDFPDIVAIYGLQGCEVSDAATPGCLPKPPLNPWGSTALPTWPPSSNNASCSSMSGFHHAKKAQLGKDQHGRSLEMHAKLPPLGPKGEAPDGGLNWTKQPQTVFLGLLPARRC